MIRKVRDYSKGDRVDLLVASSRQEKSAGGIRVISSKTHNVSLPQQKANAAQVRGQHSGFVREQSSSQIQARAPHGDTRRQGSEHQRAICCQPKGKSSERRRPNEGIRKSRRFLVHASFCTKLICTGMKGSIGYKMISEGSAQIFLYTQAYKKHIAAQRIRRSTHTYSINANINVDISCMRTYLYTHKHSCNVYTYDNPVHSNELGLYTWYVILKTRPTHTHR